MTRLLSSAALGVSALGVLAGVGLAGTSLLGGSGLPGPSLTTAPAVADLVAPAPEAYSSVVTTRDWQEVDTSGSRLTPRGSSPTNSGSSNPPRPAPLLAESAGDSVSASTALAAAAPAASTGTAASATAPRTGDAGTTGGGGTPATGSADTANPAATYLAVLQATIAQSEQSKDKSKTKPSKKSPRGAADRTRP